MVCAHSPDSHSSWCTNLSRWTLTCGHIEIVPDPCPAWGQASQKDRTKRQLCLATMALLDAKRGPAGGWDEALAPLHSLGLLCPLWS